MKIKLSQKQWETIGKKAGWIPRDTSDVSDKDLGAILTPQDEEDALLGPEDPLDPLYAYKDGSLFQPVFLNVRTDIDKEDCVISQLKYKKEEE